MILSDNQLKKEYSWMITPFINHLVRKVGDRKIISYGLSSAGYDVRCKGEFEIFTNTSCSIIDPKNFSNKIFIPYTAGDDGVCIIPPNSFVLATTIEYFEIPPNVLGEVKAKSTYARTGISLPPTVLEPGWKGNLTLEIFNSAPLPAKIYVGEGIAQIIFHRLESDCAVSYADRNGKYQGQVGVTTAKV